jgi:transketolase
MSGDLQAVARDIRRSVLQQSRRANVGHIGSCLSIADAVAALQGRVLRGDGPDDPERDRFILSKGHAALALYAGLHATGRLDGETLETFCTDGTSLGTHPEHVLEGIDASTGSLGHGLPIGVGSALAARMSRSKRRVFVLLSDAECNEGSVWEAIMFAAHHKLSNLTAIVDVNGQQALGYTRDVIDLNPLSDRFSAFGWDAIEADGHDPEALADLLDAAPQSDKPRVVLARTTFGSGVSFMESEIPWHYWPMNEEQYEQAIAEVEATA